MNDDFFKKINDRPNSQDAGEWQRWHDQIVYMAKEILVEIHTALTLAKDEQTIHLLKSHEARIVSALAFAQSLMSDVNSSGGKPKSKDNKTIH